MQPLLEFIDENVFGGMTGFVGPYGQRRGKISTPLSAARHNHTFKVVTTDIVIYQYPSHRVRNIILYFVQRVSECLATLSSSSAMFGIFSSLHHTERD